MKAPATVCVTGASGFIGSRIVERLLAHGYRVRGTVRRPEDTERYGFLADLPGASERLTLHEGHLLGEGSFDEAIDGADFVIHTASPVALDVDDPQRDLVEPAVEGTRNVLASCSRTNSVRRVVLTSSMAAVTDERDHDHVLTEADWNEKSRLDRNPYFLSKTLAEKAAWELAEEAAWELVVINPDLVAGPSLSPSLNTSREMFVDILLGGFPAVMDLTWAIVDVRDVAEAHVKALEAESVGGRYICVEHTVAMADLVAMLREAGYDDYKLPRLNLTCTLGTAAVRAMSIFEDAGTRSFLRTHLGGELRLSNAKIRRDLDMSFRPLEETLLETVSDLERWGHLAA